MSPGRGTNSLRVSSPARAIRWYGLLSHTFEGRQPGSDRGTACVELASPSMQPNWVRNDEDVKPCCAIAEL